MRIRAGWVLVVGLVFLLTACGSDASPASTTSTTAATATTSRTETTAPVETAAPVSTEPPEQTAPFPITMFAAVSEVPVTEELAAKLQAAVEGLAGGGGVSATVMTTAGTWSGSAGKADGVQDMQPDSQFGIASGTKPIIAAQVMQLVEAGEVSLDAPATDYLPDDFTFDSNGATIRQLLSHRSGIPDWYDEERLAADRSRVWELDEILALVPAARRPVGTFDYGDTNYNLLGLVIEHVRQRPLVDVLRGGVLRVERTERLI